MKNLFALSFICLWGAPLIAGEFSFENAKADKDQVITSSGAGVSANSKGQYGHGFIVGSPINSGYTGLFYKTYELHINQGRFSDDQSYIGANVHISIDNRNVELFEKFRSIEHLNHELFVFEYTEKFWMNPEAEDTHYFLEAIYTIDEFVEKMKSNNLPKGIIARTPYPGSAGTNKKMGRIVDVQRFGALGDFCAVEINTGGLSGSGRGESLMTLSVVDEDICRWIERAIGLGQEVEVDVSRDAWEAWQPSAGFVTGIKFKEGSSEGSVSKLEASPLSDAQYNELKQRLLNDPAFLQKLLNQSRR